MTIVQTTFPFFSLEHTERFSPTLGSHWCQSSGCLSSLISDEVKRRIESCYTEALRSGRSGFVLSLDANGDFTAETVDGFTGETT